MGSMAGICGFAVWLSLGMSGMQEPRSTDWPSWRGPNQRDAIEVELGERIGLRVVWKRSIGSGYSAVSIASGRAVTLTSDGERDFVLCLDAESGDEAWRFPLGPTYEGRDGSNDGPTSTPCLAEDTVFARTEGASGRTRARYGRRALEP